MHLVGPAKKEKEMNRGDGIRVFIKIKNVPLSLHINTLSVIVTNPTYPPS